jgi:hypothetical protein
MEPRLSAGSGGKLEGTLEVVLRISGVFEKASQGVSIVVLEHGTTIDVEARECPVAQKRYRALLRSLLALAASAGPRSPY